MEFERGEVVEWSVEDKATLALCRQHVPPAKLKKTSGLAEEFERLFANTRPAFSQERVFAKAHDLAISLKPRGFYLDLTQMILTKFL